MTTSPPPVPQQPVKKDKSLLIILIVVAAFVLLSMLAVTGILVAIAVPGYLNAQEKAQANACMEAQEKMDGAVDNWALDNSKHEGDQPTADDLIGYRQYLKETPMCPVGGRIAIPAVGEEAKCPIGKHRR